MTLASTAPLASAADDARRGWVFTIVEENDLIVDTDRHYTQGIRLSLLAEEGLVPSALGEFFDDLPALGMGEMTHRWGVAVGQNIYTPRDLDTKALIRSDRPYAGWLYLGLIWQRRGDTTPHLATLDHLELDLGIIGPESLAKDAQIWVHEIRAFDIPRGWRNQLDTEPGLALRAIRKWRAGIRSDRLSAEILPELGACLGNVGTFAVAGATLRAGFNVPDDFGVETIDSLASYSGGRKATDQFWFGLYGFAGVEGRAVAYTAFLDGNLDGNSHNVNKYPFMADVKTGVVLVFPWVDVALTYVHRTREYEGQGSPDRFGSLSANAKF